MSAAAGPRRARAGASTRAPARALTATSALALALAAASLLPQQAAHAHLMAAQHGTLNVVGSDAFLVLSLPVSAFDGVDDDRDGKLSMAELRAHQGNIVAAVERGVTLQDAYGPRVLRGTMLIPAPPDDTPSGPATQLVVMGRFALSGDDALRFGIDLFGTDDTERSFRITATRAPGERGPTRMLTPERAVVVPFPTPWSTLAEHVLSSVARVSDWFSRRTLL